MYNGNNDNEEGGNKHRVKAEEGRSKLGQTILTVFRILSEGAGPICSISYQEKDLGEKVGLWFFVCFFVLYFSYLLWFECVTPNSVLVIWHPVFRGGTFRKCFDHEGSGISGLAELGH